LKIRFLTDSGTKAAPPKTKPRLLQVGITGYYNQPTRKTNKCIRRPETFVSRLKQK